MGLTGCGATGQNSGKILQNSIENESNVTETPVKNNSEEIDWEAKDKNGEFTKENNSEYKEEYVEKATKEFLEYAKQNSIMAAVSAKNEGTITIAERNCNYYSISVGFVNFVQSYEYAFDEETGICLAKTEQKAISGHIQEGNSKKSFV